ncbi:hypothetical protein FACS1894159_05590 [Bacteroidia bacterium]|nr:hypothetical protein FACS1894159_05590 [Bacteroidia bacterium]
MSKCKTWIRGAAMSLFSAIYMAGCVSVDDQLGLDLVPDDQQAIILIDTLTIGIESYQTLPDSMVTSNQGYIMCGIMGSADAGATTASGGMQFLPEDKGLTFGYNPVIDSVFMSLVVYNVVGDTTLAKAKDYYIYEIKEGALSYDSTYYAFFDPSTAIHPNPLFRFSFSGSAHLGYRVNLTDPANILPEGQAFLDRLTQVTAEDSESAETFHNKFGGLWIAPDPATTPADGAICYIYPSITYSSLEYDSYLTVHARNFDQSAPAVVKDTLTRYYFFTSVNASVTSLSHDYTGTPVQAALANGTTTVSPVVYSHSPAGATPMLRFSDAFTQTLRGMMTHNGVQYGSLAINRAEIRIPVADNTIPFLNRSPQRLGMYYNYNTYSPMPDFVFNAYGAGYESYYGGYLQRAKSYYSMDITSYAQRLATGASTTPREIYLGMMPTAISDYYTGYYYSFENVFTDAFTAIDSGAIKVILTYTLVK